MCVYKCISWCAHIYNDLYIYHYIYTYIIIYIHIFQCVCVYIYQYIYMSLYINKSQDIPFFAGLTHHIVAAPFAVKTRRSGDHLPRSARDFPGGRVSWRSVSVLPLT